MNDNDELPPDPDLDDLPDELRERPGPWLIGGVDPDTGELHVDEVSREHVAAGFANHRRP
jgi:hypothetical protein